MAQTINADDGVISGSAGLKSSSDGTAILSLQTKGTTALTVDGSQNVGIGTSSPSYKLQVETPSATGNIVGYFRQGSGAVAAILSTTDLVGFGNGATSGETRIYADGASGLVTFRTNGSTRATIDSSGNLGLGVTPSAWGSGIPTLQVGNVAAFNSRSSQMALYSNSYFDGTNFRAIITGYGGRYRIDTASGAHAWDTIASASAGATQSITQAMTLDASGNLGVGTTSPAFSGVGTAITINNTDASTGTILSLQSAATNRGYLFGNSTNVVLSAVQSIPLIFKTVDTERARITSDGDFLVGTTSSICKGTFSSSTSSSQLAVTGANQNGIRFASATGGSGWIIGRSLSANNSNDFFIYDHANDIVRVFVSADGEVRIAGITDQGAYNLQVNGTGVWGAGAYVNGSDERLKDNIQSLDSGLDVVKAMRPVTFQYKPEHSKDQSVQPGFIAQELQQAMAGKAYLDGVVQSGPEYLNVAYQNIIPILTKAIQEQQDMINELKAKVAALETK